MGYFVFGITGYVAKKENLHYGAVVVGEPRAEHAKEASRRAGRRLAEWVVYFMEGRKDLHPLEANMNVSGSLRTGRPKWKQRKPRR
ncbi:hypothetical protein [Ruegeria arenilitoris]|uniref:hypothetical protein n=1 Tax=Ruegeria arenilitoris TaxID=1173585 RepID=UPI00147F487D|nr:hypothetical protein [Ruegeria arenilitoris]